MRARDYRGVPSSNVTRDRLARVYPAKERKEKGKKKIKRVAGLAGGGH